MPTIGTYETSVKVPYGTYAITFDDTLIEDKFDSKLSTVISNSDSFDTSRTIKKTPSQSISTPYGMYLLVTTGDTISVDTGFDTKLEVLKTEKEDFDTEFEVFKAVTGNFDTKLIINKDIDTRFDTSFKITNQTIVQTDFDTSLEIVKTVNPNSDTEFTVNKDIDTLFDTSLKITKVISIQDDSDTSLEIVKSINSYNDTSRTVLKEMNVLFDTKRIVKKDGEPDPEEDVVAKFVRTLAFAKTSNANFRGNTGNSHFYYPVSVELIKSMLERNFLVYERLETPLNDGTTEVELNLNNYNKPTGGVIISKEQAKLLNIIPDIELQTSKQYSAEMQEYLRQVGLEIKRQQDEISGS